MVTVPTRHPRRSIYYWKCDRPAAFHGTALHRDNPEVESQLEAAVRERFSERHVALRSAGGQGNHRTYFATIDDRKTFVRVEDGPEQDDYMEVESRVLAEVRDLGVPAPRVYEVDASRHRVPFAWQVMELISAPDLNQLRQQDRLDLKKAASEIGAALARWQMLEPRGFGPFDPELLRREDQLVGFHACYADYFHLHLDRHLHFLTERGFLQESEAQALAAEIARHSALLGLVQGCLVHKDLALWNILGTETEIAAYIDWDDSISGDAMDDLSLLGCFHDGPILAEALAGYCSVRPLPTEHRRRFWLHLLRNMIVKAVIRVGAGYFERDGAFYLIGAGSSGEALKTFTRARLMAALRGLRDDQPIETL
jgi:Ser/Thr protein kinase RdoA (MazF antagonist)